MPSTLGDVTKTRFIDPPEAHKLHVEFVVADGQAVHEGDSVVLTADGKVQAAAAATPKYKIPGVSIHDGAEKENVTIAMKAYTVVVAEANAQCDAGPVQLGNYNAVTGNREFGPSAGGSDEIKDSVTVGLNITQAAADGDEIHVALHY